MKRTIIILSLLVAGCATSQYKTVEKPRMTIYDDWGKAKYLNL